VMRALIEVTASGGLSGWGISQSVSNHASPC